MDLLKKLLPKSEELQQVEKSVELAGKIKSDLKRYRKQFDKGFKEYEAAYYGDIWKNSNEDKPYENHIFKTVEAQVPILTDSVPQPVVKVLDPAYIQQSKNLAKSIEWVNKDQNFEINHPILMRDALIVGTGWLHTYYDANANNGQGQIVDEVLHWKQVYVSGNGSNLEKADKARIELDRSRDWLKLNYPKFADKIQNQKNDAVEEGDRDGLESFDAGVAPSKRKAPTKYTDDDTLCLIKTFKRDYSLEAISQEETLEELEEEVEALAQGSSPDVAKFQNHKAHIEAHEQYIAELLASVGIQDVGTDEALMMLEDMMEQNPEASDQFGQVMQVITLLKLHIEAHEVLLQENPKGEKLKYKNALRVIEQVGNIILYDGEFQEDHGEIPLVPFYATKTSHIYGVGVVRNIIDSQRLQAVMMFKEYKGLQRVANPAKIVDKETGLTKDDITNEDGAIYVLPQGTNVRNVDPGQVSPQLGGFQVDRIKAMQDISGVNEATEGKIPAPNASGVTVERTQNQAIGRIRLIDRQAQYYSIRRLGRIRAYMILKHWTEEKVLALEDKDGNHEQLIFNPLEMQNIEFDIEISSGSMAGVDKDSFNALLTSFLGAGHITFDEFLEVAEIPRKEKLLELVKARNDQASQLQTLQTDNIKLKATINPQMLTEEEMETLSELQRQELLQQVGVN